MNQHALKAVEPVGKPDAGAIMEDVIIKGDLAKLSPEQRAAYYVSFCQSVGLNPQTQPLAYITLNNKLTLYALKGATDQLRRVHGVSVVRVDKEVLEDLYVVTVAVRDSSGRVDEDMGAAPIAGLKGEAKVNAMLKAITKAKRRATLSICGLGLLDETEVESIPGARIVPVDTETGEILDAQPDARLVADQMHEKLEPQPAQRGKSLYPPREGSNAEDYRKQELKRYHAVTEKLGLSDDAQALFAHALAGVNSRGDLSGKQLADLTEMAQENMQRIGVDGLIHPQAECANKIAAAAASPELDTVVREMVSSGLVAEFLVEMCKRRRIELKQT